MKYILKIKTIIMAQHVNINLQKELQKWNPIFERLGVLDNSKKEWMAEYAAFHSLNNNKGLYENVGYANLGNITGMGAVLSPQPSSIPGQTGYGTGVAGDTFGNGGSVGSGDYGQQLLPISMKVAAHTIGLDLVAVKPTPGPVIDLMYVDYRYDDGVVNHEDNYNPVVFKIEGKDAAGIARVDQLSAQITTVLNSLGVQQIQGGLNKRVFFNLSATSATVDVTVNSGAPASIVGYNPTTGAPIYGATNDGNATRYAGTIPSGIINVLTAPDNKEGVIEFLGFSRIDKLPMFRCFRTTNAAPQGVYKFNRGLNTFGEVESAIDAFYLSSGASTPLNTATNTIGFSSTAGQIKLDLVSALEDHIFGFVTGGPLNAMSREKDDKHYPGIIAPNVTTKRVQVGSIDVSSALKLTEIEDIKSQTGIDIVQKLESVLVNELSQTISKEIVNALFEQGELNRKSAPKMPNGIDTYFDFNVAAHLGNYTGGQNLTGVGIGGVNLAQYAPGGETTQSLQRKLLSKINTASGFIATEGRVGQATFIVTNYRLAAILMEGSNYQLNQVPLSAGGQGQLYPMGKVNGLTLYVDPYMLYSDSRILLGRKNNADQPGVIFVPYLMAQSVNLISEATFAPRLLLRSRYAVTTVGFFAQKQYITIYVTDPMNYLA